MGLNAIQGDGVALDPSLMASRPLEAGRTVRPFVPDVTLGGYWLTWLRSKHVSPGMRAFRAWITAACDRFSDTP